MVGEIERGQLGIEEARRLYGIGGGETIQKWIKKHGKNHLLAKVVRIEMVEERDRVGKLKKEKQQLESALAQAHLRIKALETMMEIASEKAGYDIKKKIESEASIGSRNEKGSR